MSEPEFIVYLDEFKDDYLSKLTLLYEEIMKLIVETSQIQEVAVVTRDELVGKLILFDKMVNSEVFKKTYHIIRITTLVYTSASIKDQKVIKYLWVRFIRNQLYFPII